MKSFILYFYILLNLFSCLINPAFAEIILPADIVEGQDSAKSWIKNSHFEKNVNSVSSYADAAGTSPVDGTGGSATITCTRTTSSPISGDGSLLITKDAANRQGQGCSIPFTIDRGDRATMQTIVLPYEVASGTFTAGTDTTNSDLVMWVYDVTNSVLIPVQGTGRFYSNTADYFFGYFQTNSNSTSYRLIFHQALTGTSAYTLKVDNVKIFKSKFSVGTIISDWVSYTYTGFTSSNGVMNSKWRRVGNMMEVMQSMEWSNTAGAFSGNFGLPTGYTIDTAKLPLSTIAVDRTIVGRGTALDSGLFIYDVMVTYRDTSTVNIWSLDVNTVGYGRNTNLTNTAPFTIAASDNISIRYSVPIVGWSSSTQQSDGYDGRLIAARYTGAPSGTPAGIHTTVTYPTKAFDTTNSYSAGTYTVPSSGTYYVSATIEVSGTESLNNIVNVAVYVDGTASLFGVSPRAPGTVTNTHSTVSGLVELRAGQLVTIKVYTDIGSPSFTSADVTPGFHIFKVNSPTTISATEKVVATYKTLSSTTITSGTALKFTTSVEDSHARYNTSTGAYLIESQGTYEFVISGINAGAATDVKMFIGATDMGVIGSLSSGSGRQSIAIQHPFNAGDSITFVPQTSSSATDTVGWLMVKKIK